MKIGAPVAAIVECLSLLSGTTVVPCFLYPMAPGMPKSIVMNQIVLIWPRGVEEICDAVFLVELCTTEGSELVPFCA